MESVVFTAVFVVLLCASGVLGQTGATGQSCSTGSILCTATTTDICGVNNICRRKVNATCASPNQGNCVLGAQCDATNTCKCKTPYYIVGSGIDFGKCVPASTYVGGSCSGPDRGTCQDVNAACTNSPNGLVCTCKGGYLWNTESNTCTTGTTGSTGMSCSSGGTCTAATDVCGENSFCRRKVDANCAIPYKYQCVQGATCDVTTTTCKCRPTIYVAGTSTNAGKCVPAQSYVDGPCTGTCYDANAVCTSGVCKCRTNYKRNIDTNACMPIIATGQQCSSSSPCTESTTDVCENVICKRKAEASCASPNQGNCVMNAQCEATGTCKCKTPGYFAVTSGLDLGKCVALPNSLEGNCTGTGTDRGSCTDGNAVCLNSVCTCKTNYVKRNDSNMCYALSGATGQTCSSGSPCTATTDICENSICKRKLDAPCNSPNQFQCVRGTQCDGATITCKCRTPNYVTGTTATDYGKCVPGTNYVGGSCTGPDRGTCLDVNAVCSNNVCTCKANYQRNIDYNICSGASGQTGTTGNVCHMGTTCNASSTDVCDNYFCRRRSEASCASPYQSQCVPGAECDRATMICRCKTPRYVSGTSGSNLGKCSPGLNYLGGFCMGTGKGTCIDGNAECIQSVCTCKTSGLVTSDDNTCSACSVSAVSVALMLIGLIVTSRFL